MNAPTLTIAGNVEQLADEMIGAEDTMRTILEETIDSAEENRMRESGRTACSDADNVRSPFARFPEAVELQSCPMGLVGTWHTHVSLSQLRNPEHSLADWSNVVFGHADVSIVVGTQTSEVVTAPENRDVMVNEFRNAIGIPAKSTQHVVGAIHSGRIHDPTAARRQVRKFLSPMVERRDTAFPELDGRLEDVAIPQYDIETIEARMHAPPSPDIAGMRKQARECGQIARQATGGVNIQEQTVSTAIGVIAGEIVKKIVFGG